MLIQINAPITTIGGLTVPSGSMLRVSPKPVSHVEGVDRLTRFEMGYDTELFGNLDEYQNKNPIPQKGILEFNTSFIIEDFPLTLQMSVDDMLEIYKTHIEFGGNGYSGIGEDNAIITMPPT
jgi:hypothetical protein